MQRHVYEEKVKISVALAEDISKSIGVSKPTVDCTTSVLKEKAMSHETE